MKNEVKACQLGGLFRKVHGIANPVCPYKTLQTLYI